MSTTTPNLSLVLYDSSTDQAVLFSTFRAAWGGTATTSNFYKIDTAYGTQQSAITSLQTTRGAISVPALFVSGSDYVATGITAITAYTTNMTILLKLDTTSNGTVTLNINSLGVKSVMKINSSGTAVNMAGGELVAGKQYLFIYDGTRWVWVNANSGDQIVVVGSTSGNIVTINTDGTLLGTSTPAGLIATTVNSATGKTTPASADEIPLLDSAASYVLKKLTWSNLVAAISGSFIVASSNGLPEATLLNGQFTTSAASNNLTVALKTVSGSDPSAGSPVYVRIANTIHAITSALSVTANAGTGWFGANASELTGKEIDYFIYMGYNATDGVTLGFARFPNAIKYGDFSATSTNPKYGAISTITNAVSTDAYVNVGRFNATLTGTNWTIPATSIIINRPINYTRWLTYTPSYSGSGSITYTSVITTYARYMIRDNNCILELMSSGTVSGTGLFITATSPFVSPDAEDHMGSGMFTNTSSTWSPVVVYITSATVSMTKGTNVDTGTGRQMKFFVEYLI